MSACATTSAIVNPAHDVMDFVSTGADASAASYAVRKDDDDDDDDDDRFAMSSDAASGSAARDRDDGRPSARRARGTSIRREVAEDARARVRGGGNVVAMPPRRAECVRC